MLCFLFQCVEEEVKETPAKDTTVSVKTEQADHSEASTPNSPITPREEIEPKVVLGTASSTTDHDILPDSADTLSENVLSAPPDTECTPSTLDSNVSDKDLDNSLAECLVEINVAVGSGRNTPSPCPSTSGICFLVKSEIICFYLLMLPLLTTYC